MLRSNQFLLNENQKRSLELTLRRLEKLLGRIEREKDLPEEKGRLYYLYNPLQHQPEQVRLLELVKQGRAEVQQLADRFDLQPVAESQASYYRGELAVMWESLIDVESTHLKAYGNVNPALAALLDPKIENLAELVLQLEALTAGHKL